MIKSVLVDVLTAAARWNVEQPLLTYLVPQELEASLRPGQLVAVPYGERLVEGIVWHIHSEHEPVELSEDVVLRPLHTLLDPEPALLPHQRALAQWMSEYYITPLAHVALLMLAPGLMQRSQFVLRLTEEYYRGEDETAQGISLRLRALLGLLHEDGALDVERLKKMLGQKRAQEILKEIQESALVERVPQLQAPKARARVKRIVRLLAQGEALEEWREQRLQQLQQLSSEPVFAATTSGPPLSFSALRKSAARFDPWAMPQASTTMTLEKKDKETLLARRQLTAVDLLAQSTNTASHWTPGALCKTTGLSNAQLQRLVKEQIIAIETMEVRRDPLQGQALPASTPLDLTADQHKALTCILEAGRRGQQGQAPQPILLHGVTGSGKTEVYLQALAAMIAQGKRGIVLVPEIALTTQAVQRVAGRFPGRVAIIHSELSIGERYDEWKRIRAGEVDVVIGSRSALFSPLPDLGLIIVDEEHEPAYKQNERRPTYHAREAALMLARILQ